MFGIKLQVYFKFLVYQAKTLMAGYKLFEVVK